MSIYATCLDIDDNGHERTCAVYERMPDGQRWEHGATLCAGGEYYRRVDNPCTCGNRAPIIYRGSHVNPADNDPRGGSIDVAAIPNHCHPSVRFSDTDEGPPVWFLRLSVDEDDATYHGMQPGSATIVLDRAQVAELRDTLTTWLDTEDRW